jgi:uncharacterized protein
MRIIEDFPHKVRELEHVWIPMPDGCRLAARIWLPTDAETTPVPALLEYIPYRKRDLRSVEDSINQPYLAGHGYAAVRVDLRGSGDSEGVLIGEYEQQEWDDCLEVLAWLERQPWCDGSVGMHGISWGGFNALQIAALQPPQLKAIITVCSTDDRYADDVHYMGGCLLNDNLSWASIMFSNTSLPPDPETHGEGWRDAWLGRLQHSGLWLATWMRHQERDEFWTHGSVCEDPAAIRCPVMAVGGWADGYSNAVFRLLASLDVPRKGLVGPWSHRYPHLAQAAPRIGYLQESLRWWDHWLKGRDTGVMDEPMLRAYMQETLSPATRYEHRPGRWVAEPSWPSPHIRSRTLQPDAQGRLRLVDGAPDGDATPVLVRSPLRTGLLAGKWCSYATGPDLPGDQRDDDAGSLVFDTPPLPERMEILGMPTVELEVAVDRPVAMLAVRLCDVDEFGASTRITYGMLNLAHRDGHDAPTPLEPGRRQRVTVKLNDVAYAFPAGHRLRLAVSTSYWPLAWPPPEQTTATVWSADSRLLLPVREPRAEDDALPELPEAEGATGSSRLVLDPGRRAWWLTRDLDTGEFALEIDDDHGVYVLEETGTTVELKGHEHYWARGDAPDSALGRVRWEAAFRRQDWDVRTVTETQLTSDAAGFVIKASLEAWEADQLVHRQTWDERIERRLL